MARPQFIFGKGVEGAMTPEQLKKNRAVADALFRTASRTPQNVGEGISAIGQALAYRIREGQNEKAEKAIGEKQREFSGVLGQQYAAALGGGGGSDFGAGAGYGSATGPIGDASTAIPAGERATYIRSGLVSRGLPEHVADGFLANFQDESGLDPGINERNPTVPGSRGGFGLYQLTGPRRDAYEGFAASRGVDPSDIDTQLDFMVGELGVGDQAKDAPWYGSEGKAARSIMAAPDTAGAAQAIVNNFLRPAPEHRSSRAAKYARLAGAAAPVQVASLDPAAGMSSVPDFGAEDVAALEARPKDPRAVPYQGPGATIDPRDVAGFQPGNVLSPPGSMSPEDQRLYDERIRGRGAQPDPAGTVPYSGPGARIDDPNAMQGGRQPPQRADPPGTKNLAVARALGIQPQPLDTSGSSMSAVAAALNGRPVATPTPRPEQVGADPSQGGDAWAGLRPRDIARENGNLQMAQAGAGQPSPFDVARANGHAVEADTPTYMGRPVSSFDPQRLLGILQNEWASDEQKAMASDILKLQGQRQQAAEDRRYKAWETQQGWAREDRRFAAEDRRNERTDQREDARFGLDRAKFEREGRQPINVNGTLVDPQTFQPVYQAPQQPFTLQPGETRFDGAGNRIAAGGAKPGYRTLTPEEVGRLGLPKGSYQVSPEGKVEDIGNKGQTINVGGGENKQVFDAMAESAAAARSAATGLNALTEAKGALDAGIISGAGADWNLGLQKIGAALGVVDPTVIQNTETFRASIAPQVAAVMKATVGSANISNSDREFAEKAAGGSINLDAGSIRRLVDIMDRASRAAIQSHLERLDAVYPGGGQFDRERALFGVRMPEALSPPDRAGSAPPARVPAQAPQQMPAQAAPPQQAPAQAQPGRQRWDRGSPSRQPAAPPPGEYRWNPATRRMEAM